MGAAGTVTTVVASAVMSGYCWRRGVRGAQGFFIVANLRSVPLLLRESLRPSGDLRRAWSVLRGRRSRQGACHRTILLNLLGLLAPQRGRLERGRTLRSVVAA